MKVFASFVLISCMIRNCSVLEFGSRSRPGILAFRLAWLRAVFTVHPYTQVETGFYFFFPFSFPSSPPPPPHFFFFFFVEQFFFCFESMAGWDGITHGNGGANPPKKSIGRILVSHRNDAVP